MNGHIKLNRYITDNLCDLSNSGADQTTNRTEVRVCVLMMKYCLAVNTSSGIISQQLIYYVNPNLNTQSLL